MSFESRDKADAIRRKFGFTSRARFPIQEVCVWYGMDIVVNDDPMQRYVNAVKLGYHLQVAYPESFAKELLMPLWLVEPICISKNIKTGEKCFFGLIEKKRGYTTQELADIFGAPVYLLREQLARLL